ncbi:hypothetical protein U1Q18_049397 [Sarracenia purpurea var. burkii]
MKETPDQTSSLWRLEGKAGLARYDGISSPAMITTILGSISGRSTCRGGTDGFSSAAGEFEEKEEGGFLKEQARIINEQAMSPSIRARPPKRYGTGEFHWFNPTFAAAAEVAAEAVILVGIISE